MSQPIDDGGPAFPRPGSEYNYCQEGMTLRDWLAGQEQIDFAEEFDGFICEALAGPRPSGDWKTNPLKWLEWEALWRAKIRYLRADAMLQARKGGAE